MISVLYQNNHTGDAFEINSLVKSAKWTTRRVGYPAIFELSLLPHADIVWEHGGIVAVRDDRKKLFYGYVFRVSGDEKGMVTVTAYDQVRHLKARDTYTYHNQRADQVALRIANDHSIEVGTFVNTGYVIPVRFEDDKTYFDIILTALDLTLINTNKMFCLWDDFGRLCITNIEDMRLDLVLGDKSLVTSYTYSSDIDTDTYNKITVIRNSAATGEREVYLAEDPNTIALWHTLSTRKEAPPALNPAQVREMGKKLLERHNRPRRTLDLKAIADLDVRAGRSLWVDISKAGISGWYIVEEAVHDLMKQTMSLKMKVV